MGWWIKRSGEIYPNPDHYSFVLSHPKLFGFAPKDIKDAGIERRDEILNAAIARGWVRVRGDERQGLTFQIQQFDEPTIFAIKTFLQEKAWNPKEKVLIEEQVARGHSWYEPVRWILSDEALAVARNPGRKRRRR